MQLHENDPPTFANQLRFIQPWMRNVLRIGGCYNIVAGLAMMILYHEGFKLLGIEKPSMNLPIQLVGMLVAIFGVGYLMAARRPIENRNILLLGFLSKLLGPVLALGYIVSGQLPIEMVPVLIVADIVYLAPFWMIYRECCQIALQIENQIVIQTQPIESPYGQFSEVDEQVDEPQADHPVFQTVNDTARTVNDTERFAA